MNERIQELAKQLGPVATIGNWGRVEWADNVYPQLGDRMYAAIDLQKFAELIVRECIGVIGEENYTMLTGKAYCAQLKRHFGVEEPKGWVCPKCSTDRTKAACPQGPSAAVDGSCPMFGVAQ